MLLTFEFHPSLVVVSEAELFVSFSRDDCLVQYLSTHVFALPAAPIS